MLGSETQEPPFPSRVILDRYELLRSLGSGGMATAFLAHDRLWDSQVTLKLVNTTSDTLVQALRAEFDLLRGLSSPFLTQVHDFVRWINRDPATGKWERCFYTADYVEGLSLSAFAQASRWEAVCGPLCDSLQGLALLHAIGVRHGDFKPSNILVSKSQTGVLIDLGCSRPLHVPVDRHLSGTPRFLAPELLAGDKADHRADLFAVGVTLADLGHLLDRGLPPRVDQLAQRLRAKSPAQRPTDVGEVLEVLGRSAPTPAAVHAAGGRLIGRRTELETLQSQLSHLLAREPGSRVLHISGPEGIGRSRLLREFKWLAQQRCRVIEANSTRPTPLNDFLSTLCDRTIANTIDQVSAARVLLAQANAEPVVCVVDDVDRLGERQLALLCALTRSLESTDPVLLAVASLPDLVLPGENVLHQTLQPLEPEQVHAWVGETLSPKERSDVVRLSRGYPSALQSLMLQLACGRLVGQALALEDQGVDSKQRKDAIATLSSAEQRALAFLSIQQGALLLQDLDRFELRLEVLQALVAKGWAAREGPGFALVRSESRLPLLQALGRELTQSVHSLLADRYQQLFEAPSLDPPTRSENGACWVYHLAQAARLEQARSALQSLEPLQALAPSAWSRAASALASVDSEPTVQFALARLLIASGDKQQALPLLERLLETTEDPTWRCSLELELGLCRLKSGDAASAQKCAEHVISTTAEAVLRQRSACLLARALLQREEYRAARDCALQALQACDDPVLRAELLESAGLASSYLGDPTTASDLLDQATALLPAIDDPRRALRTHGVRAVIKFQLGELRSARADYEQALALAERQDLPDQIATTALNLGTACHQAGDWGAALSCYERGLRTSIALGQLNTEALLRFNLTKLQADLGLFERSETSASRCEQTARQANLPTVLAALDAVRAEVSLARKQFDAARGLLVQARDAFLRQGSAREQAEVELVLADLAVASSEPAQATEWIQACSCAIEQTRARDLAARLALVRARLSLLSGKPSAAVETLEAALAAARDADQRDLQAEIELDLSKAWAVQGADRLATTHRERAASLWERTAAPLSEPMREAFWSHPRRLDAQATRAPAQEPASGRERKLELLLDINKRINSSLQTSEILQRAMDAAIDLTGAERGFVLLEREGGTSPQLEVAIARNLDREKLDRSHLKFSRGIAEQVISSGEPMVTANAQADGRFGSESSVHALHLQSVLCVPVHSPSGVLGALYLDNRFQRGKFSSDDVHLLTAFADQVAIALTNARLHQELSRRNQELEKERARIEELLRGQEAEIERLQEQVRERESTNTHRYDYGAIVGSSRALHQVFSLLDRVIDTQLPVLLQGESGTGKELVARAIHQNSPHTRGPLVSINCAAVPESLLESELFGYERGAFTGAEQARVGLVQEASGGVLFLDELGEMPLAMQAKLLRVLQEREVRPLGSRRAIPVDFRLVCATNQELREAAAQGRFRQDLYYRVSAVEIALPPLRNRVEDIPELVVHFLQRAAKTAHRPVPEVTRAALRKLMDFAWPGNIRQLENVVTKALVLAEQGRITASDIDLPRTATLNVAPVGRESFEERERAQVLEALEEHHWNVSKVAVLLTIPRPTLYRKLRRWGLLRGASRSPQ